MSGTHAERLTAQLLSGPRATTPEQVITRVLAVQGQDPRGFRLAVRSRTGGMFASDVDAAMTDRRSLILTWLNRGTLHLVRPEDYWWLKPLTTPQLATFSEHRLAAENVSPAQAKKALRVIADEVVTHGPRTRLELRAALDAARVPLQGQALLHLLFAASLRGDLVRGPMRGTEHCFVSATDWLGPAPDQLERPDALARLAKRYLEGHGPAGAADLAKWAGIGLRDARAAFAGIADEVVHSADGTFDLPGRTPAAPLPGPRLLGAFDPILHGWASRAEFVGDHQGIVTVNGIFRPIALVGGRAAATWGLEGGTLTVRLLEPISASVRRSLIKDAADVLRYLNLPQSAPVIEP